MKLRQFLKKVFEVYHPFRWTMAKVFVFIALIQALNLVTPYLQGKTIDALFSKKTFEPNLATYRNRVGRLADTDWIVLLARKIRT